jgi:putative transcriptional regulator
MSPTRLRIRELRAARGWSQLQLADLAGTRKATLSEMETGKVRRVRLDTIDRLCRALGVQPGELLAWVPEKKGKRGSRFRRNPVEAPNEL